MKSVNKMMKFFFRLSYIFTVLASIMIILIPLSNINEIGLKKHLAYIIASVFWISFLLEILCFTKTSQYYKKAKRIIMRKHPNAVLDKGIGAFLIFRNKEAVLADVIFFLSLVTLIIMFLKDFDNKWLVSSMTSLTFLSFNMHCILNGRVYKYIKMVNKKQKIRSMKNEQI